MLSVWHCSGPKVPRHSLGETNMMTKPGCQTALVVVRALNCHWNRRGTWFHRRLMDRKFVRLRTWNLKAGLLMPYISGCIQPLIWPPGLLGEIETVKTCKNMWCLGFCSFRPWMALAPPANPCHAQPTLWFWIQSSVILRYGLLVPPLAAQEFYIDWKDCSERELHVAWDVKLAVLWRKKHEKT